MYTIYIFVFSFFVNCIFVFCSMQFFVCFVICIYVFFLSTFMREGRRSVHLSFLAPKMKSERNSWRKYWYPLYMSYEFIASGKCNKKSRMLINDSFTLVKDICYSGGVVNVFPRRRGPITNKALTRSLPPSTHHQGSVREPQSSKLKLSSKLESSKNGVHTSQDQDWPVPLHPRDPGPSQRLD